MSCESLMFAATKLRKDAKIMVCCFNKTDYVKN